MDFTSLTFIFSLLLAVFIYYTLGKSYRVYWIAILSAVFIAAVSLNLLFYVLFYTLVNYYFAIGISISSKKKIVFIVGIFFNIIQLALLKYTSFTITPIFQLFNSNIDFLAISRFIVPVGVSFFTLQSIGYLINIRLGWELPEKNFIHFFLYIAFFPRFLSGPIDRSDSFLPQLKRKIEFDVSMVQSGFLQLLLGLFKKVVIANQLVAFSTNLGSFGNEDLIFSYWLVLLIQPLYLYFDFSGYTDIAIGVARLFGFDLKVNFDKPFLAENVSDFWKKYHISLSSWFHDYVFIRIIFKYRKLTHGISAISLFVTWLLFGIWHGAGWNFMVLGLLQAIAIYYEFITKKWRIEIFKKFPNILRIWLSRIITYFFYCISLTFFFASDLRSIFVFYSKLLHEKREFFENVNVEFVPLTFVLVFIVFEIIEKDYNNIFKSMISVWNTEKRVGTVVRWLLYFVAISLVIVLSNNIQEFVYFQF